MLRFGIWMTAALLAATPALAQTVVDVKKIWDEAPHNAFTDLVRHNNRWFCTFREGAAHVSGDGKIRVLRSKNGTKWESFTLIEQPGDDLRDPKLSITPTGQLQVMAAAARSSGHQTLRWTLPEKPGPVAKGEPIGDLNYWLWRSTWRGREAFGIGYRTQAAARGVRLYRFTGAKFETLVADLKVPGYPNESAIRFGKDGSALALLRRDPVNGQMGNAMLGSAKAPYRDWTWKELNVRAGGPNFIALPDGRLVAAVRLYDGTTRTSLCWLNAEQGTLTEFAKLPSNGDSSYAGMVWHKGLIWVSYYSSHEGKTSIYLAKVKP
ncbi:MAG: exo-alpha-sialidase [Acidobacteria bacterium]|nr:exo-alpha-sialidase [Acidobacteriota bacterium]